MDTDEPQSMVDVPIQRGVSDPIHLLEPREPEPGDAKLAAVKDGAVPLQLVTHPTILVFLLLCAMYYVTSIGAGKIWVVALFLVWVYSDLTRRGLASKRKEIKIEQMLNDPSQLNRVIQLLPAWVRFPDANQQLPEILKDPSLEKAQWLNNAITHMWPSVKEAGRQSLMLQLNRVFDAYKPVYIPFMDVDIIDLGAKPPFVTAVRGVECGPQNVTMDLTFRHESECKVILRAGFQALPASFRVSQIVMTGVLRVTFEPFTNDWPCFAAMTFSFLEKPTVDFDFAALKLNIMNLPLISSWCLNFIKNQLAWLMVHPNKVVVPITRQVTAQQLKDLARPTPKGILRVTLLQARGFESMGVLNLLRIRSLTSGIDPYAVLQLGKHQEYTSRTIKDTLNPEWNQEFEFLVDDPFNQQVFVHIYNRGDLVEMVGLQSRPQTIGSSKIPITSLLDLADTPQKLWFALYGVGPTSKSRGALQLELTWKPFLLPPEPDRRPTFAPPPPTTGPIDDIDLDDRMPLHRYPTIIKPADAVQDLERLHEISSVGDEPSRSPSPSVGGDTPADGKSLSVSHPKMSPTAHVAHAAAKFFTALRPSSPHPHPAPKDSNEMTGVGGQPHPERSRSVGVLIVTIVKAGNLMPQDSSGSDPYVMLTFGSVAAKSYVVRDSLDPMFEQTFRFFVHPQDKKLLHVKVMHHNEILRDVSLGVLDIDLSMLCSLPPGEAWLKDVWQLSDVKHGEIYLELEYKQVSPDKHHSHGSSSAPHAPIPVQPSSASTHAHAE